MPELTKPKQCDECRVYKFKYTEWWCGCILCYDCDPTHKVIHNELSTGEVIHNSQHTGLSTG